MNILNKLNQADRKKIEKQIKMKYIECFEDAKKASKNVEEYKGKDEVCAIIEWECFIRLVSRMNGMKEVMDILGIDYSDWAGKI